MAREDFYLEFGSNAAKFGERLEKDLVTARKELRQLAREMEQIDRLTSARTGGGGISGLVSGLSDANKLVGQLVGQLKEMGGEFGKIAANLRGAVSGAQAVQPSGRRGSNVGEVSDATLVASRPAKGRGGSTVVQTAGELKDEHDRLDREIKQAQSKLASITTPSGRAVKGKGKQKAELTQLISRHENALKATVQQLRELEAEAERALVESGDQVRQEARRPAQGPTKARESTDKGKKRRAQKAKDQAAQEVRAKAEATKETVSSDVSALQETDQAARDVIVAEGENLQALLRERERLQAQRSQVGRKNKRGRWVEKDEASKGEFRDVKAALAEIQPKIDAGFKAQPETPKVSGQVAAAADKKAQEVSTEIAKVTGELTKFVADFAVRGREAIESLKWPELQKRAAQLGVPVKGMKKADLQGAVEANLSEKVRAQGVEPGAPTSSPVVQEVKQAAEVERRTSEQIQARLQELEEAKRALYSDKGRTRTQKRPDFERIGKERRALQKELAQTRLEEAGPAGERASEVALAASRQIEAMKRPELSEQEREILRTQRLGGARNVQNVRTSLIGASPMAGPTNLGQYQTGVQIADMVTDEVRQVQDQFAKAASDLEIAESTGVPEQELAGLRAKKEQLREDSREAVRRRQEFIDQLRIDFPLESLVERGPEPLRERGREPRFERVPEVSQGTIEDRGRRAQERPPTKREFPSHSEMFRNIEDDFLNEAVALEGRLEEALQLSEHGLTSGDRDKIKAIMDSFRRAEETYNRRMEKLAERARLVESGLRGSDQATSPSAPPPREDLAALDWNALRGRAKELGIPAKGKRPELQQAVEERIKSLRVSAQAAGQRALERGETPSAWREDKGGIVALPRQPELPELPSSLVNLRQLLGRTGVAEGVPESVKSRQLREFGAAGPSPEAAAAMDAENQVRADTSRMYEEKARTAQRAAQALLTAFPEASLAELRAVLETLGGMTKKGISAILGGVRALDDVAMSAEGGELFTERQIAGAGRRWEERAPQEARREEFGAQARREVGETGLLRGRALKGVKGKDAAAAARDFFFETYTDIEDPKSLRRRFERPRDIPVPATEEGRKAREELLGSLAAFEGQFRSAPKIPAIAKLEEERRVLEMGAGGQTAEQIAAATRLPTQKIEKYLEQDATKRLPKIEQLIAKREEIDYGKPVSEEAQAGARERVRALSEQLRTVRRDGSLSEPERARKVTELERERDDYSQLARGQRIGGLENAMERVRRAFESLANFLGPEGKPLGETPPEVEYLNQKRAAEREAKRLEGEVLEERGQRRDRGVRTGATEERRKVTAPPEDWLRQRFLQEPDPQQQADLWGRLEQRRAALIPDEDVKPRREALDRERQRLEGLRAEQARLEEAAKEPIYRTSPDIQAAQRRYEEALAQPIRRDQTGQAIDAQGQAVRDPALEAYKELERLQMQQGGRDVDAEKARAQELGKATEQVAASEAEVRKLEGAYNTVIKKQEEAKRSVEELEQRYEALVNNTTRRFLALSEIIRSVERGEVTDASQLSRGGLEASKAALDAEARRGDISADQAEEQKRRLDERRLPGTMREQFGIPEEGPVNLEALKARRFAMIRSEAEKFPEFDLRTLDPKASIEDLFSAFEQEARRLQGQAQAQPEPEPEPQPQPRVTLPGMDEYAPDPKQVQRYEAALESAQQILSGTFSGNKAQYGKVRKTLLEMAGRTDLATDPDARRKVQIDPALVERARAVGLEGVSPRDYDDMGGKLRDTVQDLRSPKAQDPTGFTDCCERIVSVLMEIRDRLARGIRVSGKGTEEPRDRRSRAELREQADDLEIRGRSRMNKAQLRQAIEEAESSPLRQVRAEGRQLIPERRRRIRLESFPEETQEKLKPLLEGAESLMPEEAVQRAQRFVETLREAKEGLGTAKREAKIQYGLDPEEMEALDAALKRTESAAARAAADQEGRDEKRKKDLREIKALTEDQKRILEAMPQPVREAVEESRRLETDKDATDEQRRTARGRAARLLAADDAQRTDFGGGVWADKRTRNRLHRELLGLSVPEMDEAEAAARGRQVADAYTQSVVREGPNFQQQMGNAFFGPTGFMTRMMRSSGTFLVRSFTAGMVFGLVRGTKVLARESLETEAMFIRVSDALEATGRSAQGMRTELMRISVDLGRPLEEVYSIASNITGAFEEVADVEFATRVVAQLEMISQGMLSAKEGFDAIQTIGAAFELEGVRELERIQDTAVAIQNVMAIGIEDTIQGVGSLAGIAAEMNFEFEEMAVLVAAIAKGTNQGGKAAGEQFGRILSTFETSRGRNVLIGAGVGERGMFADGQISDIIFDMITKWDDLTEAQRRNITATFGSRREARAFNSLINRREQILSTLTEAENSYGLGQKRVQEIMRQTTNQTRVLGTNLTNLGAVLVRSGALNFLGVLLRSTNAFLSGVNNTLSMLNDLADKNPMVRFALDSTGVLVGLIGTMKLVTIGANMMAASIARQAALNQTTAAAVGMPVLGGRVAAHLRQSGQAVPTAAGFGGAATITPGQGFVAGTTAASLYGRQRTLLNYQRLVNPIGPAPVLGGLQAPFARIPGAARAGQFGPEYLRLGAGVGQAKSVQDIMLGGMVGAQAPGFMRRTFGLRGGMAPRAALRIGEGMQARGGRMAASGGAVRGAAGAGMASLGKTIAGLGPQAWAVAAAMTAVTAGFVAVKQSADRASRGRDNAFALVSGWLDEQTVKDWEESQRKPSLNPLRRWTEAGKAERQAEAEALDEALKGLSSGEKHMIERYRESTGVWSSLGDLLAGRMPFHQQVERGETRNQGFTLAGKPLRDIADYWIPGGGAGYDAIGDAASWYNRNVLEGWRTLGRRMGLGSDDDTLDKQVETVKRAIEEESQALMGSLTVGRDLPEGFIGPIPIDEAMRPLAQFKDELDAMYEVLDDGEIVLDEMLIPGSKETKLAWVGRRRDEVRRVLNDRAKELAAQLEAGEISDTDFERSISALSDVRDMFEDDFTRLERAALGLHDINHLMIDQLENFQNIMSSLEGMSTPTIPLVSDQMDQIIGNMFNDEELLAESSWGRLLDAFMDAGLTDRERANEFQVARRDVMDNALRLYDEAIEGNADPQEVDSLARGALQAAQDYARGQQQLWDDAVSVAREMAELAIELGGSAIEVADKSMDEAVRALNEQMAMMPEGSVERERIRKQLFDTLRDRARIDVAPLLRENELANLESDDNLANAMRERESAEAVLRRVRHRANLGGLRGDDYDSFIHDSLVDLMEKENAEAEAIMQRLDAESRFAQAQTEDPRIQAQIALEAAIQKRDTYGGDDIERIMSLEEDILQARRDQRDAIDRVARVEMDLALSRTRDPREQAYIRLKAATEANARWAHSGDPLESRARMAELNEAELAMIDQLRADRDITAQTVIALERNPETRLLMERELALVRLQEAAGEGIQAQQQALQDYNAAQRAIEDENRAITMAQFQTRILTSEDPMQQAVLQVEAAQEQLRQASGSQERLAAHQAIVGARRAEVDAVSAMASAQFDLAMAIANAYGDEAEAARVQLEAATWQLQEAQARGLGVAAELQAQAQIKMAEKAIKDQENAEMMARYETRIATTEDPQRQAQLRLEAAQEQMRQATGPRERMSAAQAVVEARRAQADAISSMASAQFELAAAIAGSYGDQVEVARVQLEAATWRLQEAQARGAGTAAELQARAQVSQAEEALRTQENARRMARFRTRISTTEDPSRQAQLQLEQANEQMRLARGPEERMEAAQAIVEARRAQAGALSAMASAQFDLAGAIAGAMGDQVEAARVQLDAANWNLREAQARGAGLAAVLQARSQIAQAEKALRDQENARRMARYQTRISTTEDPLRQAQLQLEQANEQMRQAQGPEERMSAAEAVVGANRARVDALNAMISAQYDLASAIASAHGDQVEVARVQLLAANFQLRDAQERGLGLAAVLQARAQIAQAEATLRSEQNQITMARFQTRISTTEDPARQARLQVQQAQEQLRQARGPLERMSAAQAVVEARRAEADALTAIADAQFELVEAIAIAHGDQFQAAQARLAAAQRRLAEVQARGGGEAVLAQARAGVIQAEAGIRDAVLQDHLDTIDFNREMGVITQGEAIKALQTILQEMDLTRDQRRSLIRQIKNLQDDLRAQLTGSGFNIPQKITLPTAYMVRRSLGIDEIRNDRLPDEWADLARYRTPIDADLTEPVSGLADAWAQTNDRVVLLAREGASAAIAAVMEEYSTLRGRMDEALSALDAAQRQAWTESTASASTGARAAVNAIFAEHSTLDRDYNSALAALAAAQQKAWDESLAAAQTGARAAVNAIYAEHANLRGDMDTILAALAAAQQDAWDESHRVAQTGARAAVQAIYAEHSNLRGDMDSILAALAAAQQQAWDESNRTGTSGARAAINAMLAEHDDLRGRMDGVLAALAASQQDAWVESMKRAEVGARATNLLSLAVISQLPPAMREELQGLERETTRAWDAAISSADDGTKRLNDRVSRNLERGVRDVANIVAGFAAALVDGINPILTALGEKPIKLPRTAWRGGGGGTPSRAMAHGGFSDDPLPRSARIEQPHGKSGLIQWAEDKAGPEAFIPLSPANRPRSIKVWEETGRRLGVESFARGGIRTDAYLREHGEDPSEFRRHPIGQSGYTVGRSMPTPGRLRDSETISAMLAWGSVIPNAKMVSGYRLGSSTYHGKAQATDWVGASPTNSGYADKDLRTIFHRFDQVGSKLRELFLTGAPWWVLNGSKTRPQSLGAYERLARTHRDHVHVATTQRDLGAGRSASGAMMGGAFSDFDFPMITIPAIPDTPPGMLGDFARTAMEAMADMTMGFFSDSWLGMVHGSSGDVGSKRELKQMVRSRMISHGWGIEHWPALENLIQRESGWNPSTQNRTSSAYGLFQFLDQTWAGVGIPKTSDPGLQTEAGLRYIRNRYGNPTKAYQHFMARVPINGKDMGHWYAQGGVFDRPSIIGVGEAGPEAVIPLDQRGARFLAHLLDETALRSTVARSTGGETDVHQLLRAIGRSVSTTSVGGAQQTITFENTFNQEVQTPAQVQAVARAVIQLLSSQLGGGARALQSTPHLIRSGSVR